VAKFDWGILTAEDWAAATDYIGGRRKPDLVISPGHEQKPYLYRWELTPNPVRHERGGTYFHIQVASDPERPLHDHPWDNASVILAGGYCELLNRAPWADAVTVELQRRPGDFIPRQAEWAHRLILPDGIPYTMSLFTMGPRYRRWGFWTPQGWVDASEVSRVEDGVATTVQFFDGEADGPSKHDTGTA
jgi:hypothetical protein